MILIIQPLYQMGGITVIFICKQRNPRHCVFSFNLPDDDKFTANLPLLSSLLVRRCTNQNKTFFFNNSCLVCIKRRNSKWFYNLLHIDPDQITTCV